MQEKSTKPILLVQKYVFAHFSSQIVTQNGNNLKFINIHRKTYWNHYLTFNNTE